jgi:anaerobic selenocysteine-containing dehydrogenase
LLHWQDAGELGVKEGDSVRVVSPRGEVVGPVQIRFRGVRGVVQLPHHFSAQPVNKLLGWGTGAVGVRVERACAMPAAERER